MNGDIVYRLNVACNQPGGEYCGECIVCEAADVIERLREQVRMLEAERDQWQRQAVRHG